MLPSKALLIALALLLPATGALATHPLPASPLPVLQTAQMTIAYDGGTDTFTFSPPAGWSCGNTVASGSPDIGQTYCNTPSTLCLNPGVGVSSQVVGASGAAQCGAVATGCTTTFDPSSPYWSSCSSVAPGGTGGQSICTLYVPYTTRDATATCTFDF